MAGRRASLGAAVYNLTKFGVTGFSEALRQEALHSNIRVTIIEPGFVETELMSHNEGNPFVMQAGEKIKGEIGEVLKSRGHRRRDRPLARGAAAREHQRGARAADEAAHLVLAAAAAAGRRGCATRSHHRNAPPSIARQQSRPSQAAGRTSTIDCGSGPLTTCSRTSAVPSAPVTIAPSAGRSPVAVR